MGNLKNGRHLEHPYLLALVNLNLNASETKQDAGSQFTIWRLNPFTSDNKQS